MRSKYCRVIFSVFIAIAIAEFASGAQAADLSLANPPIRFAIIGDRTDAHVEGVYEEIVAEVERLQPDFVMTVGDVIEGYTEDTLTLNNQWDGYFSIIKPLTMPIYFTPGNHDITTDAALGTYRNRVGEPYYSFNVRNYHFVILDVTRWESSEQLPHSELNWLTDDLAKHRDAAKTLVFFHKPFWYNTLTRGKPDTLHAIFTEYGVDAVFNGHLHCYFSAKYDDILYTAVGSSGGITDAVPGGLEYQYTWVTINDNGISIAPIRKGSVAPWDAITASEEIQVENITRYAMKFTIAAPVAANLTVPSAAVRLEISNLTRFSANDTITWQIPLSWTVQPAIAPLTIAPNETQWVDFRVSSSGNLYPLPIISVDLPFAEGKKIPISKDLRVARTAVAHLATTPPAIDGDLGDKCWADPVSKFYSGDGESSSVEPTRFYFAYDRNNLYLAVHCVETRMDSLRASVKERDGMVSGEDCVGFFLQPDLAIDTAYQFYFNPAGIVFDQKIFRGSLGYFNGEKSWNGDCTVKTSKGPQYWDIEICIPLAQLKAVGAPEKTWGLNFRRKQKRLDTSGDWEVPVDYDPQTFGALILR